MLGVYNTVASLQIDALTQQKLATLGLACRYLPPSQSIVSKFPFRDVISIIVAVKKVYPAIKSQGVDVFV